VIGGEIAKIFDSLLALFKTGILHCIAVVIDIIIYKGIYEGYNM